MGAAMAGHVLRGGHGVLAYDPDDEALRLAATGGIRAAGDLSELAANCEVIIVMVANDAQSRSVTEEIIGASPAPGTTIVVAATNHPKTMIDLGVLCGAAGLRFVDAPVCYGLQGAKDGTLISLCGGAKTDVDHITPVLECYSRSVEHLGGHGCGQLGKTCNNMMHWAACVANYEVLALARSCGINAQSMRETLLKCPARNTTLERWDTTRFTWHQKDMDVALELSQQAGLPLPLFGLVDQLVKRLGPDRVHELLHEGSAEYLGLPIADQTLDEVSKR